MLSNVSPGEWTRLSGLIAECLGLHFPPERQDDLERGITGAAREFGHEDVAACVDWLLSAAPGKAELQVLASHLTVGETYFLRDQQALAALNETILPELIRARRGREQRLRIWSAACCSGEEAYSLAIMLHRLLPDLRDWHVTINATDINPRFLHKAAAGLYSEWSFRNAPEWLKQGYFERTADGRYAIVPQIARMVRFAPLNLAQDAYPSLATDTNAMDLILCCNVLMYFARPQVIKVIGNLRHALVDGGWLVASPSESSRELFTGFTGVSFPGAILFQRCDAPPRREPISPAPAREPDFAGAPGAPSSPRAMPGAASAARRVASRDDLVTAGAGGRVAVARALYREGCYAEAADALRAVVADPPPDAAAFSLLVRALANQGRLADALGCCDLWVAAAKLDPAAHYLRAIVLLEQGDSGRARVSLRRAIYLHPGFVLAHYALGNLARGRGKEDEANRHFSNALRLLRGLPPGDLLPESDGLTASRLIEFITALSAMESGVEA